MAAVQTGSIRNISERATQVKAILTQVELILGLPPTFFTHYTLQVARPLVPLVRKWWKDSLK